MTEQLAIERVLAHAKTLLLRTVDLVRNGLDDRGIARAVATGELIRLRLGWYLSREHWEELGIEDRHLTALVAAQHESAGRHVYSHRSAATLLRLPVWSSWLPGSPPAARQGAGDPLLTHIVARPGASSASGSCLVRHRMALNDADVGSVAGYACTSPERTVFDLARTEPFALALASADAMLSRSVRRGRTIDTRSWESWRERMLERAADVPGGRGTVAARVIAHLADPRSDSVLESVSRLRLLQLGIDVEQQVPVPAESGSTLYLDFHFVGLRVFGECDGRSKYTDPILRGSRTAEEVVYAEKRRHDWIVGTTGMRVIRWGAADVRTAARFADRLRAFGVPVPGSPTRAFGPEVAAFLRRLP